MFVTKNLLNTGILIINIFKFDYVVLNL
jgi:hypothetical protein